MTVTAIRPGLHTLDVVAANGVPFRVVAIPAGTEGPNRYRAPGTQTGALVEFYDRRHEHTEHGQFAAYYDLGEISEGLAGMNLAGGVRAWAVDAATMAVIRAWLVNLWEAGALDKG